MTTWWHYLLLVNLYLILFFGFYKIFLRKETFFQLNRIYLVAGAFLSFFIPLMQSNWVRNLFITQQLHQKIYASVSAEYIYQIKPVDSNPVTLGQIIAMVYIAGAAVLLGKLAYQLLSLKRLINKKDAPDAFSFFKKIRVDERLPGKQTIIEHEEVHIRQWHSADVLFIEAVMIINWFNPVVYFYRKAIKHVHEFIADRKAIQNGTSPTEYALLLLSQTFGTSPHQLTNNFFNHSLLKQRIKMLNQNDSSYRALLKYGLSAPLFAIMLILSSATVNNSQLVKIINKKAEQALSINTITFKPITPEATKTNYLDTVKKDNVVIVDVPLKNDKAQPNDTIHNTQDSKVFNAVEINPTFPGGEDAFRKFLTDNIHYPDLAKENKVTGRVFIQFVVERDGSLSNMKTLRDPGSGLGEEAIRVLAISPKWTPGIQNGRTVRVQYTVPVNFSLKDEAGNALKPDSSVRVTGYKINSSPVVRINALTTTQKPLILIEGKVTDLKSIDPNTIKSINVFKGDSSAKYGEAAKNGIIYIILKDPKTIKKD